MAGKRSRRSLLIALGQCAVAGTCRASGTGRRDGELAEVRYVAPDPLGVTIIVTLRAGGTATIMRVPSAGRGARPATHEIPLTEPQRRELILAGTRLLGHTREPGGPRPPGSAYIEILVKDRGGREYRHQKWSDERVPDMEAIEALALSLADPAGSPAAEDQPRSK
ncbi:MAG: hypothetical protein JNL33_07350 [Betaproteobacteria bacterium]|nr:hypothetical protein [Betaproteobacteria bacterium]